MINPLRDQIMALVWEHAWCPAYRSNVAWQCSCGWTGANIGDIGGHLTDLLLSLPGIAIVELPEADDGKFWYRGREYVFADPDDPDELVMTKHGTTFGNIVETREFAAALLAAAAVAEEFS